MKPRCPLAVLGVLIAVGHPAAVRATFSIAAVDPVTQEVGSAGASCIAGSIILSDVHPGVGVIHTQAYYLSGNQNYARLLMNQGHSPDQIVDSLVVHDAGGNPTIRQYGIADLVDGGRTAGYTGVNCTNYKNHVLGPTYAIAGNILLGQQILDDMESAFLNTPGTLADRLMAALQGANVPGADTRCAPTRPAISAFLRVGRPGDPVNDLFLDLNVNNTSGNPIDMLQGLYDRWLATDVPVTAGDPSAGFALHPNHPNPFDPFTTFRYELPGPSHVTLRIYDVRGGAVATVVDEFQGRGIHQIRWNADGAVAGGVYFYRLTAGPFSQTRRLVRLE